jgi:hypothetical protein
MSRYLTIAEDIKARLDEKFTDEAGEFAVALAGVTVIVDRQKDILTMVNTSVTKATGCVVTVLWTGFGRAPTGERTATYVLRVYSRPVLLEGNYPADDIVERIATVLDEWVPAAASSTGHCHYKMNGEGADLVPDRNFLLYEMPYSVKI